MAHTETIVYIAPSHDLKSKKLFIWFLSLTEWRSQFAYFLPSVAL